VNDETTGTTAAERRLAEALAQSRAEVAALRQQLAAREQERNQAIEQQAATADILRIINRAPTELKQVLDAVAVNAARLCEADYATIQQIEDGVISVIAHYHASSVPPPSRASRGFVAGRAMLDQTVVYVYGTVDELETEFPEAAARNRAEDVLRYAAEHGASAELLEQLPAADRHRGLHAECGVPLLRGSIVVGALALARGEVRPFSDHEITLAETFADQAVIAIENTRLFEEVQARSRELQERNRDVTEALERQTATSEVLEVISRSPTNLQKVLDAICERGVRLLDARTAAIARLTNDRVDLVAVFSDGVRRGARLDRPWPDGNRLLPGMLAMTERRTVHLFGGADAIAEQFPETANLWRDDNQGSILVAPLIAGESVFGAFGVARPSPQPFTAAQVALIQTFADQAAIAIENTRLFEEIQTKSRELETVNAQLEDANRHKSAFVANMSHELRTPLNAIIGYSEMLAEQAEDLGQATMTADLGKVNAAGRHLLSLINNILDLSKIEAGRMDLYLEDFAVADLVRDVTAVVQPLVAQKGNTLVVEASDDLGVMHADLTKVRQALFNLLSNAAKFTEGGTITLTVDSAPGPADLTPLPPLPSHARPRLPGGKGGGLLNRG
jgi:signal transduction histidine kinase